MTDRERAFAACGIEYAEGVELSALISAALPIGQRVEVYSFGHWYAGEVIEVKKTRVIVRYTTGTGTTREKAYTPPNKIRRLDGARGEAVTQ